MPKSSTSKSWLRRGSSWLLYAFLLFALVSAVDWWRSGNVTKQVPTQLLSLQSIDGSIQNLAALSKQQPVLVYFWGTWCPVCPTTSPTVNWFAERYPVVSIAMSSGSQQQIQDYLADNDYHFSTVSDPRNAIAQQWGVQVTPTIAIVIDQQVVSVTTGVTTPVGLQLRLWLNQLFH